MDRMVFIHGSLVAFIHEVKFSRCFLLSTFIHSGSYGYVGFDCFLRSKHSSADVVGPGETFVSRFGAEFKSAFGQLVSSPQR